MILDSDWIWVGYRIIFWLLEFFFLTTGLVLNILQVPDEHLQRLSLYFSTYGIVFILVGVVAIVVPLFFGIPIDQLFAWLLVVAGAITLLNFLLVCGAPGTTSFLLLGALHLGVGLWMLLQPVPNPTMLIFLIAGWFLVHVYIFFPLSAVPQAQASRECRTDAIYTIIGTRMQIWLTRKWKQHFLLASSSCILQADSSEISC